MRSQLLIALLITVLSGCSSQLMNCPTNMASECFRGHYPYKVTYISSPPSARISYANSGVDLGIAPTANHYSSDPEKVAQYMDGQGCQKIAPVTATWASGAQTTTDVNLLCEGPKDYVVHLVRPNVSGIETDINYSVQIQKTAHALTMQQVEINAQRERDEYNALLRTLLIREDDRNNRTRYGLCESTVYGNSVETVCF
jgi:hypothetical protein